MTCLCFAGNQQQGHGHSDRQSGLLRQKKYDKNNSVSSKFIVTVSMFYWYTDRPFNHIISVCYMIVVVLGRK